MILFREQHEDVNVIHLIVGEETQFQFNMAGHIVVDITDNLDHNKRNIIYINKCECEEQLQEQLDYYQSKWNPIKSKMAEKKPKTNPNRPKNQNSKIEINKEKNKKYGTFLKDVRCPECRSWGTFCKDGVVTRCEVCARIKEGLESGDIPPVPTEETRNDIVQDFFNKKQQRKRDSDG